MSADLPKVVERAVTAGVLVELVRNGTAEPPEGVALSVYGIVQEALTNVVKHAAPTRCRVTVDTEPTEARVEVIDEGPPDRRRPSGSSDAAGHGLIGMRERVTLYGGSLAAGPLPDGGFAVRARLPYGSPTSRGESGSTSLGQSTETSLSSAGGLGESAATSVDESAASSFGEGRQPREVLG